MAAPVAEYGRLLTARGFSPIAVAGVLGNIERESGFDPHATNEREGAIGLAQWRGDRALAMQRHVRDSDLPPAAAQLDFLSREVDTIGGLRARLNGAKTPEDAAYIFARDFERPKTIELDRLTKARALYAQIADPGYREARGMTAERGTTDAAPARQRLSDVLPDPTATARQRLSDVLPAPSPPRPTTGASGVWEEAAPSGGALQALDDFGRAAGAAFGGDYVAAAGTAALDKLRGDPRPFSENYRERLAAEKARTLAAENRPGLGAIPLPFGLGAVPVNPAAAGGAAAGVAQSMLLPGAGLAAKVPVVGGLASGLVQGGELASLQLLGQAGSNWLSGDAPMPHDLAGPATAAIGAAGGGAVADVLGLGLKAAARLRVATPELRSRPGNSAAKQMLDAAQDAAEGAPGGSGPMLGALADRFETGQARPMEMLADQPAFGTTVLGNALDRPLGPARTVPEARFAERQALAADQPQRRLQRIFDGDIARALDEIKGAYNEQAGLLYARAGVPRVDFSDLDRARAVMRQAPLVPETAAMQALRAEPKVMAAINAVRADPLFRGLPDNSLAVLDQAHKIFQRGRNPKTNNYYLNPRQYRAMVDDAIAADPAFQPGQDYAAAVRMFADGKVAEEAVGLGRRVGGWSSAERAAIGKMEGFERDALRMGVADRLRVVLTGKTPAQIRTFLSKGEIRRNMSDAFGPDEAGAFLADIADQAPQMITNAMFKGSQTAEKTAARSVASSHTPVTRDGVINYLLRHAINKLAPGPSTGPTTPSFQAVANDMLTRIDPDVNARILRDLLGLGRAEETRRTLNRTLPLAIEAATSPDGRR